MDGQDEENRRIYNQGDFTKKGDGNSKHARKFYWWSIRRGEEEIILGRGPRMSFDLSPNHVVDDPIPQRSRSTVEGVLTKAQFSSPLLYQIHCIGPVGFGFAHIYSERSPLNRNPIIGAVCGKNLCASESDSQAWRDQGPTEQAPISLSQPDPNSRAISQTLSMAGTRKREGFGRGAWIPRKPAEVTPAWVATCPRNGTTNEPCSGR